jgi:hypothetical protein
VGDLCEVGFSGLTPEAEADVLAAGVSLDNESVDCGKLFLCASQRCQCDESSCALGLFGGLHSRAILALRESGDGLLGLFTNAAFLNERQLSLPLGVVHFSRSE